MKTLNEYQSEYALYEQRDWDTNMMQDKLTFEEWLIAAVQWSTLVYACDGSWSEVWERWPSEALRLEWLLA